jgi:methionyl-tRNA synthetase
LRWRGRRGDGALDRAKEAVPRRLPHLVRQLALDRRPENHVLAKDIYLHLRKEGLITVKAVEQFFDPVKSMFLPDRYIRGECPVCGTPDRYGDSCDVCGSVYAATALKNPHSVLSGATPVLKSSEHYFFQLSSQRCLDFLKRWTNEPGRLQPEVLNKISEWFKVDEHGHGGLADWDISRDAPYFGIEIPDAPASTSTSGSTRRSATSRR